MCTKSIFDVSKLFTKSEDEDDAYGWNNEEIETQPKRKVSTHSEIEEIIYELEEIKMKLIRYDMKSRKVK